ncbi:MAG: InlB B-repeat-containing protein [Lachnospiraceae bacterium]
MGTIDTIVIGADITLTSESAVSASGSFTLAAEDGKGPFTLTMTAAGSRHLKFSSANDVTLRFEGVVLDGGATGGGVEFTSVDGKNYDLEGAVIQNCFQSGKGGKGGAVCVRGDASGSLTLKDCAILENKTYSNGGGVYGSGAVTLLNCTVLNNVTTNDQGGGVYSVSGPIVVTGGLFKGNVASTGFGGALYAWDTGGSGAVTVTGPAVFDGTQSSNLVNRDYGAIYARGDITLTGTEAGKITVKNYNLNVASPNAGKSLIGSITGTLNLTWVDVLNNVGNRMLNSKNISGTLSAKHCTFEGNIGNDYAVLCWLNDATFEDCRIVNNENKKNNSAAGGDGRVGSGLIRANRQLKLEDCLIEDNKVGQVGTVICLGTAEIAGCEFKGNFSERYGASAYYHFSSGSLTIADTLFSGNLSLGDMCRADGQAWAATHAGNDDGFNFSYGGAVASSSNNLMVSGCQFIGNEAQATDESGKRTATGGALNILGGVKNIQVTDTLFSGNKAGLGGAFYYNASSPTPSAVFEGCSFEGNESESGGAIWIGTNYAALTTDENTTFKENFALEGSFFLEDAVLIAVHEAAILVQGPFSHGFLYAYNNSDVNYVRDAAGQKLVYTVTYHKNAADAAGEMEDQTIITGGNLTLNANAFSRVGYTFEGWGTSADGPVVYADGHSFAPYDLTVGLELYAKWMKETVEVTFDSNGGTEVPSQNLQRNTAASQPDSPTKTGYNFAGWYSDSALTLAYDFATLVTQDTILYAKWTEKILTPTDPTDPTDLPDPTDPPINPTDPPTNPTDPTDPTDSTDPPILPPSDHPNGTLVPSGNGTYVEIGDNGTPKGEWQYDEGSNTWIYKKYPLLSGAPQTGDASESPLLFAALGVVCVVGVLILRRRRSG